MVRFRLRWASALVHFEPRMCCGPCVVCVFIFWCRLQSSPFAARLTGDGFLGKWALVNAAPAPRDKWGSSGDRAAAAGNTLNVTAGVDVGVSDTFLNLWFRGIALEKSGTPAEVSLDDYLSVEGHPDVAASELGRSSAIGESAWGPPDDHPPDLMARPSKLIVEPARGPYGSRLAQRGV